ncbi:terminase, partial [Salmonella enterica]|nr:terminase [Salmonella enterica]
ALRVSMQRWQLDLDKLADSRGREKAPSLSMEEVARMLSGG